MLQLDHFFRTVVIRVTQSCSSAQKAWVHFRWERFFFAFLVGTQRDYLHFPLQAIKMLTLLFLMFPCPRIGQEWNAMAWFSFSACSCLRSSHTEILNKYTNTILADVQWQIFIFSHLFIFLITAVSNTKYKYSFVPNADLPLILRLTMFPKYSLLKWRKEDTWQHARTLGSRWWHLLLLKHELAFMFQLLPCQPSLVLENSSA